MSKEDISAKKPFKVLMTDTVFEDYEIEKNIIEKFGAEFIFADSMDEQTIISYSKDCDAIIDVYCPITERILIESPKVKVVVRSGTGVDTIDVEAANRLGVIVCNVPDYCIEEVADHTMAHLLGMARKITQLNNRIKNRQEDAWDMNKAKPMYRLRGRTLGLLGFGNIAQQVAVRAKSFGLNVMAFDSYVDGTTFEKARVIRAESLDELVSNADILSLHIPYLPENHHIINDRLLGMMKKEAILINTARGPLVDEKSLIAALETNQIAGVGLDVTEVEPLPQHSKLLGLDNAVITPHIAYYSEESIIYERQRMAEEVVLVLSGEEPRAFYNKHTIVGRR